MRHNIKTGEPNLASFIYDNANSATTALVAAAANARDAIEAEFCLMEHDRLKGADVNDNEMDRVRERHDKVRELFKLAQEIAKL